MNQIHSLFPLYSLQTLDLLAMCQVVDNTNFSFHAAHWSNFEVDLALILSSTSTNRNFSLLEFFQQTKNKEYMEAAAVKPEWLIV